MTGLIIDIEVLKELLNKRAPQINQCLERFGLPLAVVTTKWLICLFAEVLPIETVLRIWDCLFLEGYKVRRMMDHKVRQQYDFPLPFLLSDFVSCQLNTAAQSKGCYFTG